MSVLKYKDPSTGEWVMPGAVKVVDVSADGETVLAVAEQLKASGYPDYITPEVMDMVKRVNAVRKDGSIVFLAMADSHYPAEQTATTAYAANKASSVQANQAAKVLSYLTQPDFFAHLGDVATGADTTTPDMLKAQIEGFISYFREARSDLPVFIAIGNHDVGIYYHDAVADGNIHTMTGKYLYDNFTAHSASENTVFGGAENGGYCYRDFADKRLRVFLLNTSEKLVAVQKDQCTYGEQRVWLANALLDLNTKADAVDWGFIILSHYPADYGNTMPLSELLKAYVEGNSFTITDSYIESDTYISYGDNTNHTVNFSGKNGAKFIAQFHGHIHNFLTDKLYCDGAQYDAHRVCIPNAQYGRENSYGVVNGVNFSEDTSYSKTANTADGTSFVVNVINPGEQKIYSFCYGAGYDRVIGFGSTVYYGVASKLTRVTNSNEAVSIEAGAAYSATLTPDEGCEFKSVTVTMGGKDITETAYKDGVVSIAAVTGNVVITAKAQAKANFENLVPTAEDENGDPFNVEGAGYDNDVRLSSSGGITVNKGYTTTGFIPVTAGPKTIRVAGEGLSIDTKLTRIVSYDATHTPIHIIAYNAFDIYSSTADKYYNGKLIEEENTLFTLQLEDNANLTSGVYLRICTIGDGANLIVTVDDPIEYGE